MPERPLRRRARGGLALAGLAALLAAGCVTPPPPPPGGGSGGPPPVRWECATTNHYGSGALAFSVHEPGCPNGPAPAARPVVVLLHGFFVSDPGLYRGWIDHLVEGGAVVVYPAWQTVPFDLFTTDNAAYATRAALAELARPGHVAIDLANLTYAGHSAGAGIALNLAAMSADGLVPRPANVVAVEPLLNLDPAAPGEPDRLGFVRDFRRVPASVRVTILVGESDTIAGDEAAWQVWRRLGHLGVNRLWGVLRDDEEGGRTLVASHLAPLGALGFTLPGLNDIDALDYLIWAITDHWVGCAPSKTATQCGAPPSSIGQWSNGAPQEPAEFTRDAGALRIANTAGNASAYVFYPIFVGLQPWCPVLGPGVCGSPPPPL